MRKNKHREISAGSPLFFRPFVRVGVCDCGNLRTKLIWGWMRVNGGQVKRAALIWGKSRRTWYGSQTKEQNSPQKHIVEIVILFDLFIYGKSVEFRFEKSGPGMDTTSSLFSKLLYLLFQPASSCSEACLLSSHWTEVFLICFLIAHHQRKYRNHSSITS